MGCQHEGTAMGLLFSFYIMFIAAPKISLAFQLSASMKEQPHQMIFTQGMQLVYQLDAICLLFYTKN